MIGPPSGTRIWLVASFCDLRKGVDGLSALVQNHLNGNPFSGEGKDRTTARAPRHRSGQGDGRRQCDRRGPAGDQAPTVAVTPPCGGGAPTEVVGTQVRYDDTALRNGNLNSMGHGLTLTNVQLAQVLKHTPLS
jgi:IS66 Orf2 like protein